MAVRLFLSYARSDDEAFVRKLYDRLIAATFDVWFDRVSMPSRQLTFSAEIEAAISACDRLVLIVGPGAVSSDYVTHEWRFGFHQAAKCVNPILRFGDYDLLPEDLRGPHVEDFRNDAAFDLHFSNLIRQLSEAIPPLGTLVAVPSLPDHYLEQGDRIRALRDLVIADLSKPVVVTGASGRVGLHGMGGIGKSLLANVLARRPEIRREFADGVFWVTLGQKPLIVELQRNIAKALDDQAIFISEFQGRERLHELLKDRAALLILDNVWQREHAEAFNVIGSRGKLLLTTRDARLVTALAAKENQYQVQLPTESEARAMLARASNLTFDALPAEAAGVTSACGRLPLALALCGGMVYAGTSWADLLEALREHDLKFLSDAHPNEEQHANVWKAIDVSIRVLPEEEQKRFAELAVFALDTGAPVAAIETLWEHTGGLAPRYSRKLLRHFKERSLVQIDVSWMRLHDLVHDFATGMTADFPALHRTLIDGYRKKCPDRWASGPNDGYFLEHLIRHLVAAGSEADAIALLKSARWGLKKCAAGLPLSLERDYDEVAPDEMLRLIRGSVRLSMHVLARDQQQFASQMTGRLLGLKETAGMVAFVEEVTRDAPRPWIRPLHPCLEAPGGALLRTLQGRSGSTWCVAVTPDGRRVAAGSDAVIGLWDLENGEMLRTLEGHSDLVADVAVTADGQRAISASWDGTLRVWDCETGAALRTLEAHSDWVCGVAMTVDGRRAISASEDCTLKVWDLESGEMLRTLEGHSSGINGVAMTVDGGRAVSASEDCTLKVWDLESGEMLRTLEGHRNRINGVAVTVDGRRVVSASGDSTLKVWDLESGEMLRTLKGHLDRVHDVAVTADGRHAVSGSEDRTLRVWDIESGEVVQTLDGHSDSIIGVAVTADGRRAVSASSDRTLKVWDLERTGIQRARQGHWDRVDAIAVTSDGRRAVSGSWDGTLNVWDCESGTVECTLEGHSDRVRGVVVTPDGRRAVSWSGDGANSAVVMMWDLESGQLLRTFENSSDWVTSVAVTSDAERLILRSGDGEVTLWVFETAQMLRTLDRRPGETYDAVITLDGRRMASACEDGRVYFLSLETTAQASGSLTIQTRHYFGHGVSGPPGS